MLARLSSVLGCLVLVCAEPAFSQTLPEPTTAEINAVIAKAANRQRLLDFVKNTTALSPDGRVARREARLCPLVAGAPVEVNTYVASRIRQVGATVGVNFEQRACRPNLLVLFSREPEAMLEAARRRGKVSLRQVSAIRADRFKSSAQPVRWLHNVVEVGAAGVLAGTDDLNGAPEVRERGSRLSSALRSSIRNSVIVIDAKATDGVEVGALADYATFMALTDVQSAAGAPSNASILNLFSVEKPSAGQRLTPLDMAYLRGIYQVRTDISGLNQMGAVATIMADELER